MDGRLQRMQVGCQKEGEKKRYTTYTPLEEDGISFYADGSARVDIEKNELLL